MKVLTALRNLTMPSPVIFSLVSITDASLKDSPIWFANVIHFFFIPIACAHYNGSVLAEIRDYRDMQSALCPVSSAFLPTASALLQEDSELGEGCHVWQTLLLPCKTPLPIHAQGSPHYEPPTLQSMFDHFPDVTPGELETLAMDAKRQLLQEEDVLLSSSSTESSSPRGDSQEFGFFSTEPQDSGDTNGDHSGSTTTPTTRSRFHSRLETSPPASLLSPISRKSARSSLNGQEDYSTKRFKRQIQTKATETYQRKVDRKSRQERSNLAVESSNDFTVPDFSVSQGDDMEICGSSELLGDGTASVIPLPATQLFLSKLKGKRRRSNNEILYGKPAWVTIAHLHVWNVNIPAFFM
ncbi:Hypothetical protein PHPALM_17642 [Phytophthora palmivora]|uniref:Uncharacterized protein n=1 Tax=Phytophthora palmivora TaxID=4796 RepID=A0A2P4XLS9_9STRA|nr:Hypothetical protein PHPALM_17642 [Phytophthora palmivora]